MLMAAEQLAKVARTLTADWLRLAFGCAALGWLMGADCRAAPWALFLEHL